MQLSDLSIWGAMPVLALLCAAGGLLWLTNRRILKPALRTLGLAAVQMLLLGACVWGLCRADRWWAHALWLVALAVATAVVSLRQARLSWRRLLPAVLPAVLAGGGLLTGALMLCLPGQMLIPAAGMMAAHLLPAVAQTMQTYERSLAHTEEHRRYLLANGASHLESVMPGVRRAMRAAVMPLLGRLSSPLAVAMPALFGGLLMAGATVPAALAVTLLTWAAALAASVLTSVLAIWMTDRLGN